MMPPVNCRRSGWASMALFYFCLACLLWLPLAEPPLSAQHASSSGNQPQPQAQTPQPAPVCPSCAPAADLERLRAETESLGQALAALRKETAAARSLNLALYTALLIALLLAAASLGLSCYLVAVVRKRAQAQVESVLRRAGLL